MENSKTWRRPNPRGQWAENKTEIQNMVGTDWQESGFPKHVLIWRIWHLYCLEIEFDTSMEYCFIQWKLTTNRKKVILELPFLTFMISEKSFLHDEISLDSF